VSRRRRIALIVAAAIAVALILLSLVGAIDFPLVSAIAGPAVVLAIVLYALGAPGPTARPRARSARTIARRPPVKNP
jgi:hypothetical protein